MTIVKIDMSVFLLLSLSLVSYRAVMADLSEVDRGRIIGMWECGVVNEEIANRIPCTVQSVRKWIRRWEEQRKDGLKDRRKNNRRERSSTVEEDILLITQVNDDPFLSVSETVHNLNLPFSERTARRRLREVGVRCYRPSRKISLSNAHRDNCVAFALEQINTASPEDWERTIWTDEKVFSSTVDGRFHVWRPVDSQRLDPRYVIPRDRSGHITCGMWGCISAYGPGELVEVTPHMNALEYVDILQNVLLPSVRIIYPQDDVATIRLVQDNSAVHTSRIVQEWFAQHPEIEVLNWPAKSPDLNLIENVWGEIVNSWVPGHEGNRAALIAHARNAWENLREKPLFFQHLRDSVDIRLQQVIARNRYWTDY